jgi:hypothetical protein
MARSLADGRAGSMAEYTSVGGARPRLARQIDPCPVKVKWFEREPPPSNGTPNDCRNL